MHFGAAFFERETGERGYKMEDTIASIATAVGLGGIAIIRVSGPRAKDILSRVFRPHRANRAMTSHRLTYGEVLAKNLKATDITAMALAMDNDMTMVCFGLNEENSIVRVVRGEESGTTVKNHF